MIDTKQTLAGLGLAACTTLAAAGDQAQFHPLGFSESGQYYAFAQTGTQDGSGFPYAEVGVVDVAKNDLVASKTVLIESESGASPERALKQALGEVKLKRFGIVKGQETGENLLWREPGDADAGAPNRFTFMSMGHGPAVEQEPEYEIVVETTKTAPPADDPFCAELGGAQRLKLSLAGRERSDGAVRVLQDDQRLPRSRACPLGYQVRGIVEYGQGLAVVLAYTRPGFEGPDTRYMVVTGNVVPQPCPSPDPGKQSAGDQPRDMHLRRRGWTRFDFSPSASLI